MADSRPQTEDPGTAEDRRERAERGCELTEQARLASENQREAGQAGEAAPEVAYDQSAIMQELRETLALYRTKNLIPDYRQSRLGSEP